MASDQQTILNEKRDISSCEQWTPEEQVQELTRRFQIMRSDMTLDHSFKPNPDDVIAAIPPKSGTTWILHICHQLRMKGMEPHFDDQAFVVTWLEATKKLLGIDPAEKPQPAKPRIFLTHLPYELVPLGGRRLYCFRDQKDVVISAYHFMNSLLSLKGRVSLQNFTSIWIESVKHRLKDLLIWWKHRHDDDLCLLFFDDLKEDHEGCVRRIAQHINVECDEDTVSRVVHSTTHAEMVKHHSKFASRKYAAIIADKIGETLPSDSEYVGRVRRGGGRSGDGQQLPVEIQQCIDDLWQEIVTAKLGFRDLNEMRKSWKEERAIAV